MDPSSPDPYPTKAIPTPPSSTRSSLDVEPHPVKRIRDFFSATPSDHTLTTGRLEIKDVPEDQYIAAEKQIGESHWKFWYDVIKRSIIVKEPPSQVHGGCLHILHLIKNAVNTATQQEGFACRVQGGPTGMLEIYNRTNHVLLRGKEADGCLKISMEGVPRPRLPYLMVEIGYMASYEELVKDARAWLMDYDKEVLAVILVKISRGSGRPISYDVGDWSGFAEVWERDSWVSKLPYIDMADDPSPVPIKISTVSEPG